MRELVNGFPKFKRIDHIVSGASEFKEYNNYDFQYKYAVVNDLLDDKNNLLDEMVHKVLGFDEFFMSEIKEKKNFSKHLIIDKECIEPIILKYNFDDKNNQLVDYNLVEFMPNSNATLVIVLDSEDDNRYYHNGVLKILAHEKSNAKIVVIQLLSSISENYYNISIDANKNSIINFYSVCFGSAVNSLSCRLNLLGDDAIGNIIPAYFADSDRKMDLEYTLRFFGKRCNGIIDARGVTKDNAKKVFRGNLIFEKGSTKSEGSQGEFSILLSKTLNAHSIPTLFCREDDVIGAHSANVGKINQDKLLYLMSRGLTEKESKKLVILSAIGPILEAIDDKELKEKILIELDKRV